MGGAEYPKALYRDGGADHIWGAPVRTLVVLDAESEARALDSGWRLHPIAPAAPSRKPGRPRKMADV